MLNSQQETHPSPETFDDNASSSHDDEQSKGGSSSSGTGTSGNADAPEATDEYGEMQKFQASETKRVNVARRFVLASILIVGSFVSILIYMILRASVDSDKSDAYKLFSSSIEESFKSQVADIFDANRALSRAITSSAFALGANEDFPLFSVPAFESLAYEARHQGGFEIVVYAPISNRISQWLNFTQETRGWLDTSKELYDALEPGENRSSEPPTAPLHDIVWDYSPEGGIVPRKRGGFFVPILHVSPPPIPEMRVYQNINLFSKPMYKEIGIATVQLKDSAFSSFEASLSNSVNAVLGTDRHEELHEHGARDQETSSASVRPHSAAAQPVYKNFERKEDGKLDTVVAYLFSVVSWERYLVNLLPEGVNGMHVVLRNSCNQSFTYEINGPDFLFLGEGELYDRSFKDRKKMTITFDENYLNPNVTSDIPGHCRVFLDVHSTKKFEEAYESNLPIVMTCVVGCLFLCMAVVFATYDIFVQSRNRRVLGAAAQSNAIVSQVFPSNIRMKMMEEAANNKRGTLKGFLSSDDADSKGTDNNNIFKSNPIADFFPETTVLFADIAGFTAWSSVREPAQVFTLLETVYFSFDEIAKRRRVFKVETVGDCYVAVCGLPEPRKDHAITLARFAQDCMNKMNLLTKQLEVSLGPDTGDLAMRMGLHSGPVTAGVLRGERSRFQLFGDTMNTAARMESNGQVGRIQASQETADLLIEGGKAKWVSPREEKINAKGKGEMQTFWISTSSNAGSQRESVDSSDMSQNTDNCNELENTIIANKHFPQLSSEKVHRLIGWNTDVMVRLLKQIIARRMLLGSKHDKAVNEDLIQPKAGATVIDEVAEIVSLPHFDSKCSNSIDLEEVELCEEVVEQLKDYLTNVCALYRSNPFHNFEHASHVTMSVVKLLSRIVAPSETDVEEDADASTLHDYTYGITSDPLTQFSCVLSAIIHDLDHPGVPNSQLVKEDAPIVSMYKGKSIAEQNSVDIAWQLLMEDRYSDLRSTIYTSEDEMKRFRQLIVNSVMATDIMDKDLKQLRNARWDKAFKESTIDTTKESIDRKATIVIEHLIQASDVAHTMQHWHVYRKWNERFFMESYKAFKEGRAASDPSINWYKGEMGFFDFYIIPLAKKLRDCGVFGVSCDEYLNYAMNNRREWELRGEEVLAEMMEKVNSNGGLACE